VLNCLGVRSERHKVEFSTTLKVEALDLIAIVENAKTTVLGCFVDADLPHADSGRFKLGG
jgi:hypothetical protein